MLLFAAILLEAILYKGLAREIVQADVGTTTSRGYPEEYPADSDCTHRIFSMEPSRRVTLEFLEFDLYRRFDDVRDEDDCDILADDHLRIFDVIQNQRILLRTVCGSTLPLPIMSAENQLIVQFRSYKRSEPVISKNLYKFRWHSNITNFGINHPFQDENKKCIFRYSSMNMTEGKFYSPNFPGFYPRNTHCQYSFHGSPDEKILFAFTYFDVEGYSNCSIASLSDFVEFEEPGFRPFRFCGDIRPGRIESTGTMISIHFISNQMFDGTGFEGQYRFMKKRPPVVVKLLRKPPRNFKLNSNQRISTVKPRSSSSKSNSTSKPAAARTSGTGAQDIGSGSEEGSGSGETVDPSTYPNVHIIDS